MHRESLVSRFPLAVSPLSSPFRYDSLIEKQLLSLSYVWIAQIIESKELKCIRLLWLSVRKSVDEFLKSGGLARNPAA